MNNDWVQVGHRHFKSSQRLNPSSSTATAMSQGSWRLRRSHMWRCAIRHASHRTGGLCCTSSAFPVEKPSCPAPAASFSPRRTAAGQNQSTVRSPRNSHEHRSSNGVFDSRQLLNLDDAGGHGESHILDWVKRYHYFGDMQVGLHFAFTRRNSCSYFHQTGGWLRLVGRGVVPV